MRVGAAADDGPALDQWAALLSPLAIVLIGKHKTPDVTEGTCTPFSNPPATSGFFQDTQSPAAQLS